MSVLGIPNETVITVVLIGLGVYFSILLARGVVGYVFFRKVRSRALLTWRLAPPPQFAWVVVLGVVSLAVAILNITLQRPLHHLYGQFAMSAYFILMVPLTARIHRGLYEDGVWAESGFLPYASIGRMAFREGPEIILILLPRGRSGSFRLPVPREEYGAVRKVLEEKIRTHAVNMDAAILGL